MKQKRRFYITVITLVCVVYIVLLLLMLYAESGDGQSSIHTFMDALWYSVVTLTTVGYGDITPVTPMGHVIGIIFVLLSTCILITVVSTLVSFLTSEGFPLLILSYHKRKDWYYFADTGQEAYTLAEKIFAEDPRSVIIFGANKNSVDERPEYSCLFVNVSPERLVWIKHGHGNPCKVFFMRENDIGINSRAVDIARLPVEIYAGTASGEEYISPNIHFFHSSDCCAREYWRCHPLTAGERRIVLIGFGNYGRALLQRAIMTNVISPDQQIAYHIFGDAGDFLNVHYGLRQVFSIQEESKERDSLIFHEDSWASAHVILEDADRIIISEDEEQENWRILWQLRQYYHVRGRMDMRSVRSVAGLPCFGSNDTIYTPEHILRTTLNQVAISMNDLYRSTHTGDTLDWSQLDDCLKQSKIAASEHIIVKVRILLQDEELSYLTQDLLTRAYMVYERNIQNPEELERYRRIEHLRWLRFYAFYNWGSGDVHDQALRQDPCFCPYEELAPKLRHHYDYAWTVIGRLKLVS